MSARMVMTKDDLARLPPSVQEQIRLQLEEEKVTVLPPVKVPTMRPKQQKRKHEGPSFGKTVALLFYGVALYVLALMALIGA